MLKEIVTNEIFIFGVITMLTAVIGVAKRKAIGKAWSIWGNRVLGKKAQDKIEEVVADIVTGAKEDNGK